MNLSQRWQNTKEHWRFRYGERIVNWLIGVSTYRARQMLDGTPISVLIDNSVLGHGITHETAWISTGTANWGSHEVETGYAARIAVHAVDTNTEVYENIKFLPGIAHLARKGMISLWTSAELLEETYRQPIGRFRGYGYFDHSIFNDVTIESVDGRVPARYDFTDTTKPNWKKKQQTRLESYKDERFLLLVEKLGSSNNLDAWHIHTAEMHNLFCFLTMDFRLKRTIEGIRHLEPFRSLTTKVMTPVEFGETFGLLPVPPVTLSYHNASFPVRADLNWSNNKRNRPKPNDN